MIQLESVIKDYSGPFRLGHRVRALDGITLDVAAGTALGVIGLNGAGKSTLLRLLLGYLNPSGGRVAIEGLAPREYAERHGIAYLPERAAIPPGWTVRGALEAYAMLDGLGGEAAERVDAALERLGIQSLSARRVGALSKGNLQRLAIAQMLLSPRRLMVLDEPTDGLDPVWVAELRKIVAEWRAAEAGRVVVIASHNLPEVERLTERVIVLHAGRVRAELAGGGSGLEERFLQLAAEWEEAA
jgi:ABC-type multidrug transport system ATPase subunit